MGRKEQVSNVDKYLEEAYTTLVVNDFYGVNGDTAAVVQHLAKDMGLSPKRVAHVVAKLVEDNYLIYSKKDGGLLDGRTVMKGVFHATSKANTGFVSVEGIPHDIRVKGTKYAREGDIVEVAYFGEDMPENVGVSRIVRRVNNHVIGVVVQNAEGRYVLRPMFEPNSQDYLLGSSNNLSYYEGQICKVKINVFESPRGCGAGEIEMSYGFVNDQDARVTALFEEYGFSTEFPDDVLAEVEKIPDKVLPEDFIGRVDLRHLPIISCDPEKCKDKDDAYCIEKTPTGYRAYIAIADVAHYVKPGSAIDREAAFRATSVYCGKYVNPMLPPKLSNGICSLHAGVDRLAVVKVIDVDNDGRIVNFDIQRAVIHAIDSISYEQQEDIFLNKNDAEKVYASIKPMVDDLYASHRLIQKRMRDNGKIEIEDGEPQYIFDENNNVIDIVPQGDEESHDVVESYMVTTNRIAAQYCAMRGLPVIFRNHTAPTADKVNFLNRDLKMFGIDFVVDGSAQSFQKLLAREDVKHSKYYPLIKSRCLRTQQKAYYDIVNEGHFALGILKGNGPASAHLSSRIGHEPVVKNPGKIKTPAKFSGLTLASGYAQGSSAPIRLYHGIINQRMEVAAVEGVDYEISKTRLAEIARRQTERTRAAESLERDANRYFNTVFAASQIGKVFDGYIKEIHAKELVVSIKDGMVDITLPTSELKGGLNAHYKVSENHMQIIDVRTGHMYNLADTIPVRIASVDYSSNNIIATTDMHKKLELPQETLPSARDLPSIKDIEAKLPQTPYGVQAQMKSHKKQVAQEILDTATYEQPAIEESVQNTETVVETKTEDKVQ